MTLGAILFAAITSPGCGHDDRLPLFPASGKVVVDGKPAKGVEVRLVPAQAPDDPDTLRPFATSKDDGSFALGTYEAGDGAPEGKYKATLFWPDRPPGPSHPNDLLGGDYVQASRSGFEVAITKGTNTIPAFEAKVPAKPTKPRTSAKVKGSDGLE